jgi:hypothetical protein
MVVILVLSLGWDKTTEVVMVVDEPTNFADLQCLVKYVCLVLEVEDINIKLAHLFHLLEIWVCYQFC